MMVVEPYNIIQSALPLLEHTDVAVLVTNEAVDVACAVIWTCMLAQTISSLTVPLRLEGTLNMDEGRDVEHVTVILKYPYHNGACGMKCP